MNRIKRLFVVLAVLVGVVTVLAPAPASAASAEHCAKSGAGFLNLPTWYKYLNPRMEDGACKVDATIPDDLGKILLAVFEVLLRIGGIVAVIFVLYGSIQYIISQGEPENIKNARTTIMNALIGLLITMLATGIVNLIGGQIA